MDDIGLDTAFIILKMIETVDPQDTAKLDEIDARVAAYRVNEGYVRHGHIYGPYDRVVWTNRGAGTVKVLPYTRSRDALKAIRLENWPCYEMRYYGCLTDYKFWKCEISSEHKTVASVGRPTEELAELHAIIQAIEYERRQK